MRWVRVNQAHFNLDQMEAFRWSRGKLLIYWQGDPEQPESYEDKDRANYKRLCVAAGVAPIPKGGNEDGQN
jgi:hypothetical protein